MIEEVNESVRVERELCVVEVCGFGCMRVSQQVGEFVGQGIFGDQERNRQW